MLLELDGDGTDALGVRLLVADTLAEGEVSGYVEVVPDHLDIVTMLSVGAKCGCADWSCKRTFAKFEVLQSHTKKTFVTSTQFYVYIPCLT